MSWYTDGISTFLFNASDAITRGGNQAANMAAGSQNRTLNPFDSGVFVVGDVIRVGAGTYDVSVQTPMHPHIVCIMGQDVGTYYFGTVDCTLPVEGSRVLVCVPLQNVSTGVIIRVLPPLATGAVLDTSNKAAASLIHSWDLEPSASSVTETRYDLPSSDPDNPNIRKSNNGRPLDLMPGNKAWVNEQGVGMAVLNLLATLKASDRARIDVCLLDDIVRVVSGCYRHINAQGEDQIYNDGGRLTREVTLTSHQCEKSGFMNYGEGKAPFEVVEDTAFLKESMASKYKLIADNLAAKTRFQLFLGHLGDIVNLFVAEPYPIEPNFRLPLADPGLLHTHIDSSGRLQIRSAAGISLERWDRIPVPRRMYDPWDPAGDKMEAVDEDSVKLPFEWSEEYPYARSLEMRDAMAWRNRQAYLRINDQSQSASRKDFFLPEEKDMTAPDNLYDNQGNAIEDYKANATRRAYMNVEDDGSIVIRDAWGSEIILRGGNIILNCAGQVEVRSGGSIVQLAGHDIVSKAMKSVDITARDHDVRIKANTNLQLVSEGRAGEDAPGGGGILLESRSVGETQGYKNATGEDVRSSGIVLKADNSRVLATGHVVHLASPNSILIDGKNAAGEAKGNLEVGIKTGVISADRYLGLVTGTNSGLVLTRNVAVLAGRSVALVAERNTNVVERGQMWVPFKLRPAKKDPYPTMQQRFQDSEERYIESNGWLGTYDPISRLEVKFTYRSSKEYGTMSGTEVYNASEFYVYEAVWAMMAKTGHTLLDDVQVANWTEYDIANTFPWPGADAYGKNCYVMLETETNIGDPTQEVPVERAKLKNTSGDLKTRSFHEYEVARLQR